MAMREDPRMFYITTGGEIWGHNTQTFRDFQQMVENSDLESRFHFAGWVPTEHIRSYYEQADVAINVDLFSYEGELGHRNRIFEWIEAGTPVVTTAVCDFVKTLVARDLVVPFEIGNPRSLADALKSVATDPEGAKARAARAREFLHAEFTEEKVYQPLLEWVKNPVFAKDRQAMLPKHHGKPPSKLAETHAKVLQREYAQQAEHSESGLHKLRGLFGKLVSRIGE